MSTQALADARAALAQAEADVRLERIQQAKEQFHKTVRDIRMAENRLSLLNREYKRDEPALGRLESELALLHRHLSRRQAIIASGFDVDEHDELIDPAKVQHEIAALEAAITELTPQVFGLRREQAGRVVEISRLQRALTGMELGREQYRTIAEGGTVAEVRGGIFTV